MTIIDLPKARVTASKTALLLSDCTAWAGHDVMEIESEEMKAGRESHARLEKAVLGEDVELEPLEREAIEWLTSNFVLGQPELVMCVGPWGEAGTFPGAKARAYDDPTALWGTADVVAYDADGCITVIDWKASLMSGLAARDQLLTLATIIHDSSNEFGNGVRIISYALDGSGVAIDEIVQPSDMDAHMEAVWDAVNGLDPQATPVPGMHCMEYYCPRIFECPATKEMVDSAVAQIIPASALKRSAVTDPVTNGEQLAYALEIYRALEAFIEHARNQIKAFVDQNEGKVALPDGRFYRQKLITKKMPSMGLALALAARKGASAEELAGCKKPSAYFEYRIVGSTKPDKAKTPKKAKTKKVAELKAVEEAP